MNGWPTVGVAGARGVVGSMFCSILADAGLPAECLRAFGHTDGNTLDYRGASVPVHVLTDENAAELDFRREHPVPHMAFGYGGHHCLGSHLARMVLQVSVGSLIARFPGMRLAVPIEDVEWNTVSIWRYPLALPVAW